MKSIIVAASVASFCLAASFGAASASTAKPVTVAAAAAEAKAVCQSCHGPQGKSALSAFPRLNGQTAKYIVAQLGQFKNHARSDPHAQVYMWPVSARLDATMIAALGTYYAGQKPTSPQLGGALAAEGQKIFLHGVASEGIPACHVCHGQHGEGNGIFPRIAGQHGDYLKMQMEAFRSTLRANRVMHANTQNLTDDEIEALSSYLAND